MSFPVPHIWRELVAEHGTPLVINDLDIVREQTRILRTAFPFARLHYSLKANHHPDILRALITDGCGVDAVSPLELELALHCGASARNIIYIENNMTDGEMQTAMEAGARLIIGSMSRLERFAGAYPGASCGIRINGDIGAAQHARANTGGPRSKFGIHHSLIEEAFAVAAKHEITIDLLHQHIGSGWLDTKDYERAADVLIDAALRHDSVRTLDFGGGFGIAYQDHDHPLEPAALGKVLWEKISVTRQAHNRDFDVIIEPGRFLVGPCAWLLAEVQDVKPVPGGRTFVGTNTGFNHLIRPALYDTPHRILNLSNEAGGEEVYSVVGNICESTDIFAEDIALPRVRVGDVLAFCDYGAYGAAMASQYNLRPPAAEVTLDNGRARLSRRRMGLGDILSSYAV